MTLKLWASKWGMKVFIGAVIVMGFFGPYVISLILALLCLAIWAVCRSNPRQPHDIYARTDPAISRRIVY